MMQPHAAQAEDAWAVARLIVIYDERCEFCRRCRAWLEGQPQLVPLDFAAAGEPAVAAWANGRIPVGDELVVVADDGATWVGPAAFIVCLWALRDHRRTAVRLQRPSLRPLAKQFLHAFSAGRGVASLVLTDSVSASGACSDGGCKP